MTKNQKIFAGIDNLVQSKKLDRDLIIQGLEEALLITLKKTYEYDDVEVSINYESKRIVMLGYKEVVTESELVDNHNQISLEEALEIRKSAKVGDQLKIKIKLEKDILERAIVQSAKQVFRQKIKEAEYKKILENYGHKVGEIIQGRVEEIKDPFIYFKLQDDTLATLGPKGRIVGEILNPDIPVDLVIEMVAQQSKKGPKVIVSRTSLKLVSKAMEDVIPEIQNGDLTIKSIAREAGSRSKVAIDIANIDSDVDIIGSCVGPQGQRINEVKRLLGGENIDLIEYFEDPIIFISNALAPAIVTAVQILDEEKKISRIIVTDDQFSLAIGVDGQNVRLASILTGWKIDIKSETQAKEEEIVYEDDII
ncbi:MAG: transcription termination factor NusA [Mycoplasmatales bacterium]